MATDPVEKIAERQIEATDFGFTLWSRLKALALMEPSIVEPYLTVTLDLRPEGGSPERRPGPLFLRQRREEIVAPYQAHSPERLSLEADLDQIEAALADVDPAVRGAAFVARSAGGVFESILLGIPLPNDVVVAPTPALRELVRAADDRPLYAVLLLDQREATLTIVAREQPQYELAVTASDYPRRQMQGGWSQRRYQLRADERIEAFARTVAEESGRLLHGAGVELLVLAGDEQITTTLRSLLDHRTAAMVIGSVRMSVESSAADLIEAANPLVDAAEREREADAVRRLNEGAGPGGAAATGIDETLAALQAGQVMTLVMNADFAAEGWGDYTLPVVGAGPVPHEHPAGGNPANLVPIAVEQEVVRLALATADGLEIVDPSVPVAADELPGEEGAGAPRSATATALDRFGGVGAILRFVVDEDHSTPDL